MRGDNQNDWIIDIGQNTEKSPGDLRRFVLTQTPVKDHRPSANADVKKSMSKKKKKKNNNNNKGALGVMVIVVENGHDDTSSNPGWDWLHFT